MHGRYKYGLGGIVVGAIIAGLTSVPRSAEILDLDGDGLKDVKIKQNSGLESVLYGLPDGSFSNVHPSKRDNYALKR